MSEKKRQKNLEILRCLAMMMVVVLHFLGKGELLGDVTAAEMGRVGICAWVLEAFCIVAVNCYMLISGYFLCESHFKLSRLLGLYLQIWTYSVGVGIVAAVLGWVPETELGIHYYLSLLLPVSMGHYWFMTAYVFFYMMLPLLGMAVKKMNQKQSNLVLIMFFAMFAGLKSVLPARLEEDGQGYNFVWYICMFLLAAYIRKFGIGVLKKLRNCVMLYVGGCVLALAELFVLRAVYLSRGSLGLILKISFEYNHVFVAMAAVGLFGCFLHCKGEGVIAVVAAKLSPYVLGVYLLHENIGIRYIWPKFLGADKIENVLQLIIGTVIAMICVFITGVIIEVVRSLVMKILKKLIISAKIGKKIFDVLDRADQVFVEKMN